MLPIRHFLSYGGALLKKDFQEKSNISKEDKKKSIYFLNLMHSIIEDTALVFTCYSSFLKVEDKHYIALNKPKFNH
jgi:hypothetical protein